MSEEKLNQQSRLLEMITRIAATYMEMPLEAVESAIDSSLGELGDFVGADRAHVVDYDFKERLIRCRKEWCREGIHSVEPLIRDLPLANIPAWDVDAHRRGESIWIADSSSLPPDALRELLVKAGNKSLLAVPIMTSGECSGFINFSWIRQRHTCSSHEERLLLIFGLMLANIRRRERDEKSQRESEQRFRNLFNNAAEGMYYTSPEGKLIRVNMASARILGYETPEEALDTVYDIPNQLYVNPDDRKTVLDILQEKGIIQNFETQLRKKDGSVIWVSLNARLDRNTNGSLGIEGSLVDITERKRMMDALLESEERFRNLSSITTEGIMIHEGGVILDVNKAFAELIGFDNPQDLIGRRGMDVIPFTPESALCVRDHLRSGTTETYTIELTGGDGRIIPAETNGNTITYKERTVRIVRMRDITERRQAEEALRLSASQLKANLENTPNVAVQWYDESGRILYWNRASEILYGWKAEDAVGRTLDELIHTPEEAAEFLRILDDIRSTGEPYGPFESSVMRRDGSRSWVLATAFSIPMGEGRIGFVCMDVDITEKKQYLSRIQEELREKDVLLKEVHHRVKNNLQVISSLLMLQSNAMGDARLRTAFQASRDRIRSISLIHEKLYRTKLYSEIDFEEYVKDIFRELAYIHDVKDRIQLDVRISSVKLDLETAIPCGMIINEMMVNAMKHAFPEGRTGKMSVGMRAMKGATWRLTIKDDGIGLPAPGRQPRTPGIGVELIHILTEQLGGTVKIRRSRGTACTLNFPMRRT